MTNFDPLGLEKTSRLPKKADFAEASLLDETVARTSSSMVPVESRPLTLRESEFAHSLASISRQWAHVDITLSESHRGMPLWLSVCDAAQPAEPQNAIGVGHQGPIGELSLSIRLDHGSDVVSVLLHQAQGSLSLLEIIWYNFPEPVQPSG
ncbi:hypothetical protein [Granulicella arctica]|uniref:hypothetical protein n=1 Tax=Granulicella arctica TaxID=940613 RepID=UPI0021E07AF5|nr:hypothetical protein [Granulicella arctica]